jgi:hypothetical protein
MSFETLLDRAGIAKWNRAEWFRTAKLVQSTLLVSDIDDFGGITRQFSDRLREAFPGLVITFAPHSAPVEERPASKPKPSAFKKAWRGELGPQGTQGGLY